jgi:hypothetical protein
MILDYIILVKPDWEDIVTPLSKVQVYIYRAITDNISETQVIMLLNNLIPASKIELLNRAPSDKDGILVEFYEKRSKPTVSKKFLMNISYNIITGENPKQFIFCLLYCYCNNM